MLVEDFKNTAYIQLLNKGKASTVEFDLAFSDFAKRIYNFCIQEEDYTLTYFTLHYIKTHLIHIKQSKNGNNNLSTAGGIAYIDAALTWIIQIKNNSITSSNKNTPIVWTGKVIHLMELIYGSDTLNNFNNGKVTIKEIAEYFSKMLGVEIKDPSGCYVSMRERVQESRTTYIDSMRDALLKRMDKDDEKAYRRKR